MEENKKKICVIIPAHWEQIMGGSQYQAKVLFDYLLKEQRYELFYLSSVINSNFKPDDYDIIQIAERKGVRRYGYFFDAPRLLRILSKIKPDVIYQRVGCGWTGISAYYAKKHGCKMVWHVAHDRTLLPFDYRLSKDIVFRFIERKILEFGIKNAGKIVAQTQWQKQLLRKRYGRNSTVIPNFHPLPTEKIEKGKIIRVAWVANLKAWKRPELFVALAEALRHIKNVEFVMVGRNMLNTSEMAVLEPAIQLARNLRYIGPLSQSGVNKLLASAHVFVNTSRYEGFANTFIQAWMRKTAVVSLEVDPDKLLSQSNLGLFSDGDFESMKKQVESLITDQALRKAFALLDFLLDS